MLTIKVTVLDSIFENVLEITGEAREVAGAISGFMQLDYIDNDVKNKVIDSIKSIKNGQENGALIETGYGHRIMIEKIDD